MNGDSLLTYPIFTYSAARSAFFAAEFQVLNSLQHLLPGARKYLEPIEPETAAAARRETLELFRQDSQNIADGIYPPTVLIPESPVAHALRFPRILLDGLSLYRRRQEGRTTEFDENAREFFEDVPRYYRRNFHYQTDGYLSDHSAELYEHQVELLFGGSADAMRRLILPPLREEFGRGDGKGLAFLEVGAGTGRATRFVRQTFPKAKLVVSDVSHPYLKQAARNLSAFSRLDYVHADGAHLPFQTGHFDAAYSVFLFHELPHDARLAVLAESKRVLKPGGFIGFVDSLQTGDYAVFDSLLRKFPENYHEPFYRNYISHPMEQLLREAGFEDVRTGRGFFSKVCWARAPR
jgi:ubiquinone/menaquinone biosynthesis C-methylase UbiE